MFEKLPYEMTDEEIEQEIKKYFDETPKDKILKELLEAGFTEEDLNMEYFNLHRRKETMSTKVKLFKSYKEVVDLFSSELDELEYHLNINEKISSPTIKPLIYVFYSKNKPVSFIALNVVKPLNNVFLDIYLKSEIRYKGYASLMYTTIEPQIIALLKRLDQRCIYATVNKDNYPSLIVVSKKLKFKALSTPRLEYLRKKGLLGKNELRFEKCYF